MYIKEKTRAGPREELCAMYTASGPAAVVGKGAGICYTR
jgi:hypothetical protein